MRKNLLVLTIIALIFIGGIYVLKSENIGSALLWQLSNEGRLLFPLVTAGALIDSVNPCAFSILILTIAFLFSLGRLRSDVLKIGLTYILGIFLVYILIGLGILKAFHLFNTPNFMGKLGAGLLVILGSINLINVYFPAFPIKLKIPYATHRPMAKLMEQASIPAAFLLGGFVGLCEFPCTGGPYLMVLGLLHDKVTYLKGAAYLIYYNLLFVLPLLIILLIAGNKILAEKVETWQKQESRAMRSLGGLAMVALGAVIFLFV